MTRHVNFGMSRDRYPWALVTLFLAGCNPPPPTPSTSAGAKELPTVTVTAAPLAARSVPRVVSAVGTLHGFDEVTLSPAVDGRVARLAADVGDVVIPGTVLLELDATDYRLAATEAKHALSTELAKLGLSELPPGELDVEAVPAVRKADVALANAVVRRERVRALAESRSVSKDEFDVVATEAKLAEATKQDVVTQSLATLAAARLRQAMLESAEQKLEDCLLRVPAPAPFAAWAALVGPGLTPIRYAVAAKLVAEGEMVRSMPVTNAYKLVIDGALKLRAAVPERFTGDVRVGQSVEVRVDAYPKELFRGRVARVNPTVDPQSRTFQVEVAVPNFGGRLKAGGFARAAIQVRTDSGVPTVPPPAVHTFAGVSKLFVLEAGKARPVEVEVGLREREWVEVLGDVPAGATVATSGLTQLVDGSPVKLRD